MEEFYHTINEVFVYHTTLPSTDDIWKVLEPKIQSAFDKAREEERMTPQTINEVSEKIGFKRGYEAAIMDSKVIPDIRLEERNRIIQMIEGMIRKDTDPLHSYMPSVWNQALYSLIEKLK